MKGDFRWMSAKRLELGDDKGRSSVWIDEPNSCDIKNVWDYAINTRVNGSKFKGQFWYMNEKFRIKKVIPGIYNFRGCKALNLSKDIFAVCIYREK